MSESWNRWAPLTGVVFVAVLVASFLVGGSTPDAKDSAAKVISFYHSHGSRQNASAYLTALSLVPGLLFFAYLRSFLGRVSGVAWLATAAFAGAIVFAVGGALIAGVTIALADVPTRLTPAAAQALNVLSNDLIDALFLSGIALLMIANGAAVVISRPLPVWLGWAAIVVGVAALVPPVLFPAFLLMGIWLLVVSILISRRNAAAVRPAAPAPPGPEIAPAGS